MAERDMKLLGRQTTTCTALLRHHATVLLRVQCIIAQKRLQALLGFEPQQIK